MEGHATTDAIARQVDHGHLKASAERLWCRRRPREIPRTVTAGIKPGQRVFTYDISETANHMDNNYWNDFFTRLVQVRPDLLAVFDSRGCLVETDPATARIAAGDAAFLRSIGIDPIS